MRSAASRSVASRERLEALGIDVWVRRGLSSSRRPARESFAAPDAAGTAPVLRVRMASGDGDWLLVQDAAWDGRHEVLLGDIQAAIGSARCRFGQWAHSESAGVRLDELDSRGVSRVLVFGDPPDDGQAVGRVVAAPPLESLASQPEARRRLWQLLAPELDD